MKKTNRSKLPKNIAEILIDDILESSDEEILTDAKKQYGDVDAEIAKTQEKILSAILESKKSKMTAAKEQLSNHKNQLAESNVLSLPFDNKKAIIEKAKESEISLTLAARNEEEMSESDADGVLQDLIDLGVIDEDGNLKE